MEIPSYKVYRFPPMVEPYRYLRLATLKSNVIAIGKRIKLNQSSNRSLEVYSEKNKSWNHSRNFHNSITNKDLT